MRREGRMEGRRVKRMCRELWREWKEGKGGVYTVEREREGWMEGRVGHRGFYGGVRGGNGGRGRWR